MNKIGKTFLRCAAFLLVLLACVQLAGRYITPLSNEALYAYDSGGIYAEPKDSIDVLVIGSSNASRDVTPMQWYAEYGITGYTFGIGAGSVAEVYYALYKIFRTQTPKVVVLCADTVYNIADGTSVLESTLDDTAGSLLPLWRYHNDWRDLRPDSLIRHHDFTWKDYDKGFTPQTGCVPMDATWYMADTGAAQKVPFLCDRYVQAIRSLCRRNDSKLMMVTLPAKDWTMARHLGMKAYAEKNDIPYTDYCLPESGLTVDWTQDTYDSGFHLNYVGALKITKHLGQTIAQNYALPDRRTTELAEAWEPDLARYRKEQKEQLTAMLEKVPSAADYLTD